MKSIVLVSNTSWYLYNFRSALIEALIKENYIVVIIAPKDDYSDKLKNLGCKFYDIEIDKKANPIKDLKFTYDLYNLFKKIKPDLFLGFTIKPNIYGGMISKILDIPTISTITGLGAVFLHDNLVSKIAKILYKISFKKRMVVFQNLDDKKVFLQHNIIDETQSVYIPGSGVDMQIFKPKKEVYSDNNNIIFLLIARLIKDKGIVEYIEAIRSIRQKYPNAKFKLLGAFYEANPSAISQDDVQSWVAEGLIEYIEFTDEVFTEIEKADCIVLPSYREGLSKALLEAASMCKPIITTDVPGCREIVTDGFNGYLIPAKNIEALAEAIKKMINISPNDRKIMGNNGRKKIKDFNKEAIIEKYLTIIKKELK